MIGNNTSALSGIKTKWKTVVALICAFTGILFDNPMFFGLLYISWAVMDITTGHAYIIEDIARDEHPVLFWLIVIIWLLGGLSVFLGGLFSF